MDHKKGRICVNLLGKLNSKSKQMALRKIYNDRSEPIEEKYHMANKKQDNKRLKSQRSSYRSYPSPLTMHGNNENDEKQNQN